MQLGMIGLGRMGANIVRRLMREGHECVVYDLNEAAIAELEGEGAVGARSLEELREQAEPPRAAWVMVPAAFAGATIRDVAGHFERGDIIIDGGNSYYRDDLDHAPKCTAARHPFRRRRHERRGLRARARLLPHDRRREAGLRAPRADLPLARAGCRGGDANAGRARAAERGRARLSVLRRPRRRALRQDGAQRHRVRDHGRDRRGHGRSSRRPTSGCRSTTRTPRRLPCGIPSTTSTASTWPRSPRSGAAAA